MKFQSKKQQERYEKGLCINCDNVREGKRLCQQCKEKNRLNRQKIIEQGLCVDCRKSASGKSRCSRCSDKVKEYKLNFNRKRIENHQCIDCGQPNSLGSSVKNAEREKEFIEERMLRNLHNGVLTLENALAAISL